MRENRLSGSEGGATLIPSSLPLSFNLSLLRDKEICQFVLDHWVFNPKATGVYKLPVLLPAGL